MSVLAAASTSTDNPLLGPLLQLGVVGVALIALGWFALRAIRKQDATHAEQRGDWERERLGLIDARQRADLRREQAEESREKAAQALQQYLSTGQAKAMEALTAAQSALTETVTRQHLLEQENEGLRRQVAVERQLNEGRRRDVADGP